MDTKAGKAFKAFPAHVRVIGMKQIRGSMIMQLLPPKLCLPKSSPTVESWADIDSSCFMDRVARSGKRAIYTDGALAWKSMATELRIPCRQVSHQSKQFVARRSGPQPHLSQGLSKLKGTQSIDRAWRVLKRNLPQCSLKRQTGASLEVSPLLATHVFSRAWRYNLGIQSADAFARDLAGIL